MNNINFRPATVSDAEKLGSIAYEAFYKVATEHNFPPDIPNPAAGVELARMIIDNQGVFSVVAENGDLVGSNFLWESDEVDGVGPITVDPAAQNGSVGRQLMERVIKRSEDNGKAGIRLCQAAYHNRSLSLYLKLGFEVVEPISVVNGPKFSIQIPGCSVRTMTKDDVQQANKLCLAAHGISRKNEISAAAASGTGLVVERAGRLTGYATILGFFGHAVAETNDDLKALIGSGREIAGLGILIPTRNSEAMRWCLGNGMRIVMPLSLMKKGYYRVPQNPFLPSILY